MVAVGGGALTDVAGFAAATFRRGLPWIAVPTTLVGQVDAAIGGKTAIDVAAKNDVGAFHLPEAVIADPMVLTTLPPREWAAGFAEVVKTALLAGGRLWELVRAWQPGMGEADERTELVRLTAAYKARVVGEDPTEQGVRAVLNLGHTIGHGVEAASGYGELLHGEAVAIGLLAALRLSVELRGLDEAVLARDGADPRPRRTAHEGHRSRGRRRDGGDARRQEADRRASPAGAARFGRIAGVRHRPWGRPADAGRIISAVIAVLNGVNLNLLGRRDPELYGSLTLSNLESKIYKWSRESGTTARCFQTNHEGAFVDNLHEAVGWATHGMAVNPGAWTHYSYAIRDAIEYVVQQGVEVVEVHLSDIEAREEFRRHSVLADVVSHRPLGPERYRLGVGDLHPVGAGAQAGPGDLVGGAVGAHRLRRPVGVQATQVHDDVAGRAGGTGDDDPGVHLGVAAQLHAPGVRLLLELVGLGSGEVGVGRHGSTSQGRATAGGTNVVAWSPCAVSAGQVGTPDQPARLRSACRRALARLPHQAIEHQRRRPRGSWNSQPQPQPGQA